MTRMALVAACLLSLPGPALAKGKVAPARAVDSAMAALREGDFEKALRALDAADLQRAMEPEAVQVWMLRAQCYLALQLPAKAEGAMREALKKDPAAAVSSELAGPQVQELLERVRAGMRGDLSVQASESGATARVDGQSVGTVPLKMPVSIGRHGIDVTATDGRSASVKTVVREGRITDVYLELGPPRPPPETLQPPPAIVPPPPVRVAAVAPVAVEKQPPRARWPWVPLAMGVAGCGAGTYFLLQDKQKADALRSGPPQYADARALYSAGKTDEIASQISFAVGGVGLAAGLLGFLFTSEQTHVAWVGSDHGALLVLSGEIP